MKAQTIVLGEYDTPPVVFALYQIPAPLTPPLSSQIGDEPPMINYYCLDDIAHLFFEGRIHDWISPLHRDHPGDFCKDQDQRAYIKAELLARNAKHLPTSSAAILADLCRLQRSDVFSHGANAMLAQIPTLTPTKVAIREKEFVPRHLDGTEWYFHSSPQPRSPSSSPNSPHELSPRKPSSLWLKRLAPRHDSQKATHLTISTPSYQRHANAIHSAPLRPLVAHGSLRPKHIHPSKIIKPSSRRLPSTPSWVAPKELPSTPIVPSQHPTSTRPGHLTPSAPKTSLPPLHQLPLPHSPLPPPRTSSTTTFHLNHSLASKKTPKQQFMQPFEYLYDTIEQTRASKATLDDQIRKSSSLLQTLQSSSDMVENLVRRHLQDNMEQPFEKKLLDCVDRITRLEQRLVKPQGAPQEDLSNLINKLDKLEQRMHRAS